MRFPSRPDYNTHLLYIRLLTGCTSFRIHPVSCKCRKPQLYHLQPRLFYKIADIIAVCLCTILFCAFCGRQKNHSPNHAAHKSGGARRKPGTGFSDAISRALSRFAAQSSESEKTLSSVFFTLSFRTCRSEKYSEHSNLLALYIVVLPHENTPVGISTPGV